MKELFLKIIHMSISASWLILAVLILRFALKRAPKWVNVLLWGIVAVKLICPFSMESPISLVPASIGSGELVSEWMDDYIDDIDIHYSDSVYYDAAIDSGRMPICDGKDSYYVVTKHDRLGEPATVETTIIPILSVVWIAGVIVLTLYMTISYWRLVRNVDTAILYADNIFQSENVNSPFVLGIIKPRIYLPFKIHNEVLEYVIAHEQTHIHRKDHLWKPLGFVLLTVHWFNPLMWLGYVLLCRDIELACDEKVIKQLDNYSRANYTQALVACSVNRHKIAVCPLAFGEIGVKDRVKSVMNYKKPTFWMIVLGVISCVIVAFCFLTNPVSKNTVVMGANYNIEKVLYAVTVGDEVSMEPPLQYCVTADYHLYYQQREGEDWNYLGALTPYELTNDELDSYMSVDEMRKNAKIRQITDSYILKVGDNNFYLVFQTKNGKTYLGYGWEGIEERGQVGDDDTKLHCLYQLDSSFHSDHVNVNFFQRSLVNTVGNPVYNFANFESDKIPGYHICAFKSGNSENHEDMTDLGFAVFQTTGEGYRLIDCKVYKNAALVENGIFFCDDPVVADRHGEMRNDNTFDVILILNEDVDKVQRVYHAQGKEDWIQDDTYINAPYMSLWSWDNSEGYTTVSQYFYDKNGKQIPVNSVIPLNSASWENLPDSSGSQ